jgi:hypothetical protein
MGAPQWFIDQQRERDQGKQASDEEAGIIDVLAPNWPTVLVYMACLWTIEVGGSKPVFRGISAQEARAAVDLVGVPSDEWPRVQRGLQIMVEAARSEFDAAATRGAASKGPPSGPPRKPARR